MGVMVVVAKAKVMMVVVIIVEWDEEWCFSLAVGLFAAFFAGKRQKRQICVSFLVRVA
jgi:hypothetical protein